MSLQKMSTKLSDGKEMPEGAPPMEELAKASDVSADAGAGDVLEKQEQANEYRRMVLIGDPISQVNEEDEEEEYDFEEDQEAENKPLKWFAITCYYSGHSKLGCFSMS